MKHFHSGFILLLVFVSLGQTAAARPQSKSSAQEVKRGQYLVEEVAKCPECHTPRDKNNQLDRDRWLQGAPCSKLQIGLTLCRLSLAFQTTPTNKSCVFWKKVSGPTEGARSSPPCTSTT
jgi:hypothetical protein